MKTQLKAAKAFLHDGAVVQPGQTVEVDQADVAYFVNHGLCEDSGEAKADPKADKHEPKGKKA